MGRFGYSIIPYNQLTSAQLQELEGRKILDANNQPVPKDQYNNMSIYVDSKGHIPQGNDPYLLEWIDMGSPQGAYLSLLDNEQEEGVIENPIFTIASEADPRIYQSQDNLAMSEGLHKGIAQENINNQGRAVWNTLKGAAYGTNLLINPVGTLTGVVLGSVGSNMYDDLSQYLTGTTWEEQSQPFFDWTGQYLPDYINEDLQIMTNPGGLLGGAKGYQIGSSPRSYMYGATGDGYLTMGIMPKKVRSFETRARALGTMRRAERAAQKRADQYHGNIQKARQQIAELKEKIQKAKEERDRAHDAAIELDDRKLASDYYKQVEQRVAEINVLEEQLYNLRNDVDFWKQSGDNIIKSTHSKFIKYLYDKLTPEEKNNIDIMLKNTNQSLDNLNKMGETEILRIFKENHRPSKLGEDDFSGSVSPGSKAKTTHKYWDKYGTERGE